MVRKSLTNLIGQIDTDWFTCNSFECLLLSYLLQGGKQSPFWRSFFVALIRREIVGFVARAMHVGKGGPETPRNIYEQPPKKSPAEYHIMTSNRGWLQPSSCPWLDRFSTVSGDGPDSDRILISPLRWQRTFLGRVNPNSHGICACLRPSDPRSP